MIGKRQLEQAVVSAAGDIAAFYAARVPVPCTSSTLLVISADATGIVIRPGALRPVTARAAARQGKMRTRLTAGEKPNRKRMLAVLAGDSARAAAEITTEADADGLTAAQRAGAGACVRYLTGKDECLRYGRPLAAGWPVATGVIEGACRRIIGDRLCITGARWGLEGAEAVLTLRAVTSNGDFDEYWRFHLAREHQRLYPGTVQGQSTLTA